MNLNKQIRQTIIDRAITQKFEPLFTAHNLVLRQFGDRIYQTFLGEFEPKMQALPNGFLRKSNWIELISTDHFKDHRDGLLCEFDIKQRHAYTSREWGHGFYKHRGLRLTGVRLFPHYFVYDIGPHQALLKEIDAIKQVQQSLLADLHVVEADMYQLLHSVKTKAALLAVWPEIEPLIPEPVVKSQLPIPHDIPQRLTSMLGLPPVAAAVEG